MAAKQEAEDSYDDDCGLSMVSPLQKNAASIAEQFKEEEVKREEDPEDEFAISSSQVSSGVKEQYQAESDLLVQID